MIYVFWVSNGELLSHFLNFDMRLAMIDYK